MPSSRITWVKIKESEKINKYLELAREYNNNNNNNNIIIPETTLADYMYQEKREEEDLLASKTALIHRYNDSKTT